MQVASGRGSPTRHGSAVQHVATGTMSTPVAIRGQGIPVVEQADGQRPFGGCVNRRSARAIRRRRTRPEAGDWHAPAATRSPIGFDRWRLASRRTRSQAGGEVDTHLTTVNRLRPKAGDAAVTGHHARIRLSKPQIPHISACALLSPICDSRRRCGSGRDSASSEAEV